jgi:hypothetical protein
MDGSTFGARAQTFNISARLGASISGTGGPFDLRWRAEPAYIWFGDARVPPPLANGMCVLYLGTASGLTIVYDPTTEVTVQILQGT